MGTRLYSGTDAARGTTIVRSYPCPTGLRRTNNPSVVAMDATGTADETTRDLVAAAMDLTIATQDLTMATQDLNAATRNLMMATANRMTAADNAAYMDDDGGGDGRRRRGQPPAQFDLLDAAPACGDDEPAEPRAWFGVRHVVTFLLFLGMANAYTMRTNMSVAIVAMIDHSALDKDPTVPDDECDGFYTPSLAAGMKAAEQMDDMSRLFRWSAAQQGYILGSFFYGYVITQIPFGVMSRKYGAKWFLGVGMLINSLFGFLVPCSAYAGIGWLMAVRFVQGLGEGPIVPCTHALLAKWVPPDERSRMASFVYSGAQFGTVISLPLSGMLAGSGAGWPSIFYVFGGLGTVWSLVFLWLVHEDPDSHPTITPDERRYIVRSIWGTSGVVVPVVPWLQILLSPAAWAVLFAHMGQNYGYETLMTELPTFMKQVLHFDIKSNGTYSSLPYLAMWIFSNMTSCVADKMIQSRNYSHAFTRKMANSVGQFGPAVALIAASYTGCNPHLTVAILTAGVGMNGAIYSGFKVNHLDISPRFAGVLMSVTNCLANLAGLLAPIVAGYVVDRRPTQAAWRTVFVTAACVYAACGTVFLVLGDGARQPWDDPSKDDVDQNAKSGRTDLVEPVLTDTNGCVADPEQGQTNGCGEEGSSVR